MQYVEDHQLRICEKPLFGFGPCSLGGSDNGTKMLAPGKIAQMLQANARQPRNFVFCEELLPVWNGCHYSFLLLTC